MERPSHSIDLAVLSVISSFQDVSGWKLREIVKNRGRTQKGNSYKSCLSQALLLDTGLFKADLYFFPPATRVMEKVIMA